MSEKSLFCGMNKPADPGNLTETEKKHIPVIDCPDTVKAGEPFKVAIKVGEIPHVMQEGHSIQWIEVLSGESFLARVDLTPVFTAAEVTVTLVKSGKHRTSSIRVVERCNLHGQWEAVKQITINE
ncbi:MAG: class II SORL domain-containing protein [Nitrospirae bacterium]|nr:class II SORL domain-containing protein [Nitrospirota bacterium]